MKIVIPYDNKAQVIFQSSFVAAKRQTETEFSLMGDNLQMSGVTAGRLLIFSDDVAVVEGQELTDDLRAWAIPLEALVSTSPEEALPNAIGLLLRQAVTSGAVTDAELLEIQPALEGRQWRPGLAVRIGDVFAYNNHLWRCIQAHTTQGDWPPDMTPALWHKVEIIPEDEPRVWDTGIEYAVQDVVAYPDVNGPQYECLQAHTSQVGWEPPNAPALWKTHTSS